MPHLFFGLEPALASSHDTVRPVRDLAQLREASSRTFAENPYQLTSWAPQLERPSSPEFGLHKHLFNTRHTLVELLVKRWEILDVHSMSDNVLDVEFARLDVIVEDLVPVQVDWCLTITDESNTLLHQGSNVEVVGESRVDTDETDSTEFLG